MYSPFLKRLLCIFTITHHFPSSNLHSVLNSPPPTPLHQMYHCGCDPLNTFYSLSYCVHIYTSSPPSPAPLPSPPKTLRRPNRRPKRAYIPLFPRPPTTTNPRLQQAQCALPPLDPRISRASGPPTCPLPPLPRPQTRRSRHRLPPHH